MSSTEPERPSRRWPRWWQVGLALVLLALLGLAARFGYIDQRNRSRLREVVARLDRDDPGWRLADLEAGRREVPDAKNGAHIVISTYRLLPRAWPDQNTYTALEGLDPPALLNERQLATLDRELARAAAARLQVRRLLDRPDGRHEIAYARLVIDTLLKDQQDTRMMGTLLRYDALRAAQDGDLGRALDDCRMCIHAARTLGDEPLVISQLIRIALAATGVQLAERVLAQGEAPAEALKKWQDVLELEDRENVTLIALRGERAATHILFEEFSSGREPLEEGGGWLRWVRAPRERAWLRSEYPGLLEMMTKRVEAARRPPHEQPAADRDFATEMADRDRAATSPFLLLVPALDRTSASCLRHHASVRCAFVAAAIERYRQAETKWPAHLGALVPEYLHEVPLDPYDGKRLRFRTLKDGVLVYSTGPDGVDDGGKVERHVDRPSDPRPGTDLGFQLWDVGRRRQPPPP